MTGTTMLPSNKFGRIEQRIVFSIPAEQEERLLGNLDFTLLHRQESPPRTFYLWQRWSTRRGDDDGIVFELSAILGIQDIDWHIDWSRSVY